ncbi:response regulator transcription factor [Dyella sp.]|uniref:response regulator transcription factor n=1 Tax=Dyella sp. TaxID=1869338 RepID=UPI002B46D1E4|nr:response regulator transcription factor [Dyella sp.]HKT29894.1 response regulator transcription factor [Dyella sp.]
MPPLHVVVLEDDAALRQKILLPALNMPGFAVQGAASTAELYQHMLMRPFDMVVLGMGPDDDGVAVTRQLRAMSDIGIVILADDTDRTRHTHALRAGADVCLAKPVDVQMLLAALQSLARRLMPRTSRVLVKDDAAAGHGWRLDAGGWRLVSPHGKAVLLTSAEQCVVNLLARERDQPVSREVLIRALNRRAEEFDPHRLEMLVHRLRRKAQAQTGEHLPLLTARGVGYLLACELDDSAA